MPPGGLTGRVIRANDTAIMTDTIAVTSLPAGVASAGAPAVFARGLTKRFGAVTAIDRVDLEVPHGTIFAILGPNGAGKTTLMRMLATLARPDAGAATVMGHDLLTAPGEVRGCIAMTGQFASLDEDLTGRENLVLLARLWGFRGRAAWARADDLLAAFDLADAARRQVRTYSGGMRRRLDIAASLVVTPGLLFLDEPTTGLDPKARQGVWRMIRGLASSGVTILLTTQYLEEADQLAARIAVIDHGRKIAEGTSRELKAATGSGFLHVTLADTGQLEAARGQLARLLGAPVQHSPEGGALSGPVASAVEANRVLGALTAAGIEIAGFSMGSPSLEEVFFALTGNAEAAPEEGGR
ncbi:ABC transporter, ATP-binding protein [Rhodovulum sp. PH10]|nr:ABC transporter, ATP-binding protein [Rhodovulum sp. PH10]